MEDYLFDEEDLIFFRDSESWGEEDAEDDRPDATAPIDFAAYLGDEIIF